MRWGLAISKRRHDAKGRSTGVDRFVQLPFWVMESQAFRDLSLAAKVTLPFVVKRFNGTNNGKIPFGARSGCFVRKPGTVELIDVSFGLKPGAVAEALFELRAAGFIACEKESIWTGTRGTKGQGVVREWRLTWLPTTGQLPTKEFTTRSGNFRKQRKRKPAQKSDCPSTLVDYKARNSLPAQTANASSIPSTPHNSLPPQAKSEPDSLRGTTHLVTIPSGATSDGADGLAAATSVSVEVLRSPLISAARCPQGSKRVRAPAPKIDLVSVLAARTRPEATI